MSGQPRAVAVIGGGPAGLMAAEVLSLAGVTVTVIEQMPSPGRKFLMAGRGGLNLTHSEALPHFLSRYGAAAAKLTPAIDAFTPADLRGWADGLQQPTFVGSSGRVFPVALKASPLLRAWLRRLDAQGVRLRTRRRWTGWDGAALTFESAAGERETMTPDAVLLALGGASWPKLGATGNWVGLLAARGVAIAPLRAANCGFTVGWSDIFRERFQGQPLKNIALAWNDRSARGDAMITAYGVEGGAVYALSAVLREAIVAAGAATIAIDLRPDLSAADLARRLQRLPNSQTLSTLLRKTLSLSPVAINLLREAHGKSLPRDAGKLASLIKAAPVTLVAAQPLARAISTAGGVAFEAVDDRFMLKQVKGVFVAGEMLDWEAPTGGYLLQTCFATGRAAAQGAIDWLQAQ